MEALSPDNNSFTRVFLIRHASAYDEEGLQTDHSPLNQLGVWQARRLAERLRETPVNKIYSSPTKRAFQTAEIVAEKRSQPVIVKDSLQELFWEFWPELGHFHYDRADQIQEKLGSDDQLKMLGVAQKKGLDVLAELYRENRQQTVFAFTHGNLIRAIVSAVMESGLRGFLSLTVSLASVTILDLNLDTYRLITVSDGCHTLGGYSPAQSGKDGAPGRT